MKLKISNLEGVVMFTSEKLVTGKVYSRADLRKLFDITAATLNNGVFKPMNYQSVWLFITEEKTADMTDYVDHLKGDFLFWEGQLKGRTDSLIIDHEKNGLEILVFYRKTRIEFPGSGFRYEGQFCYKSHSRSQPARFVLQRVATPLSK